MCMHACKLSITLSCISHTITAIIHGLLKLAIRRSVKQLEGNKLDHSLRREELWVVCILHLFLYQGEHGSVQQRIERVVVKLAHGHLNCLFFVVLYQLLQVLEHLARVAAAQYSHKVGHLSLVLGLHARVE